MQFRNRLPISKLVSNFTISNLRSAISKLRKFANCTEHIHVAESRLTTKQMVLKEMSLFHRFGIVRLLALGTRKRMAKGYSSLYVCVPGTVHNFQTHHSIVQ